MKKIETLTDLKEAISTVVAYNWKDEQIDYAHHKGDKNAHIYMTLVALHNFIHEEE